MSQPIHRTVPVPGGRIHLVEQGEGPIVLLVHGFPESWHSWRHQLPALADAGYRAVAIDVRGYGRSSKPHDIAAYRMLAHVADNTGVVRALDAPVAAIVGHDWGSPIAANTALLRPDLFPAVALLSVPYTPRSDRRPTEAYNALGGTGEFYITYFQEPGRAEAEIEPDIRTWLRGVYTALSGETHDASVFLVEPGGRMSDHFTDRPLPGWFTEADLDFYTTEFERTGLTGALNRYRNVDRDWEDLAAWRRAPLTQPSLYAAGELDATTTWLSRAIAAHATTLPGLVSTHILEGCGHWIQQERPAEVNELLIDWLRGLSR
ncbi:alpha/beta hydrolase [Actinomadura sp. DC4]|uniref:alpha/beta fold hydrolase n=1 Tax=Actinomadura sp. DC4 TaxID=3055069 RepID=UPI0025B2005B|nr:alpha/beta hydrolase [Actinomadura sp. DC4]MDN3356283.1 alpha/beta hydrolase [Actinomadura sp. DC4]